MRTDSGCPDLALGGCSASLHKDARGRHLITQPKTAVNAGASDDRGIQEICAAGKRRRSRHRRHYRRRLRRDRELPGRGYHVADHRRYYRRPRFLELLSAAVLKGDCDFARRSQETRRGLAWGSFLTVVINFIIIAWVLFLVVKLMNQMMQSEAPKAPALTKQETLLTEIRDLS